MVRGKGKSGPRWIIYRKGQTQEQYGSESKEQMSLVEVYPHGWRVPGFGSHREGLLQLFMISIGFSLYLKMRIFVK
jgi:hypothetical protein